MSVENLHISPIAVFAFNRVDMFKQNIAALQKCELADQSDLYIFSDGAKLEDDKKMVAEIREFSKNITRFKQVHFRFSETNKGLANSIIQGVSEILKEHETIIVLEDDLKVSTNFLSFMNAALTEYRTNQKIMAISGYSVPLKVPKDHVYDSYFTKRMSSWGWATWRDRWSEVDWNVSDYHTFKDDTHAKRRFNAMGSDLSAMLIKQMKGKINSWAIRFCYHQFKHDLYSVHPVISKIENNGFDESATHTKGSASRFITPLDTSSKNNFDFNRKIELDKRLTKQMTAKYSIKTRAFGIQGHVAQVVVRF